jgi:hypothetical protein
LYNLSSTTYGLGGPGGGGRGGFGCGPGATLPGCGTLNTGSGGGGGGLFPVNYAGGTGANGTVILAIPTPAYPTVTAPGAGITTPANAPGYTVLTYTSPARTTPGTFTLSIAV